MSLPQALCTAVLAVLGATGTKGGWAQGFEGLENRPPDLGGASSLSAARDDASALLPTLAAVGASIRVGPAHPGAQGARARWTPNLVMRWGRFLITNGGPLASRAGEPAESGLSTELLSLDRLQLGASLSLDQGRDSAKIERLAGLHDIPSHLRGRLRAGWRLHEHWVVSATLRSDLSGRGTGHSIEGTLLHQWRPEFLDGSRWGLSIGGSVEWLDDAQANAVHGVTQEDARRTRFPAYRLDSGIGEWRVFTNWRREIDGNWLAFGHLTASHLSGDVARSPLVQRRSALSLSVGVGKRL